MGKFLREKKLGLIFLLIFFLLLVISLIKRDIFHETYQISIFFVVLIFIFSQYFDFEYRLFIGFDLGLLIICIFLLVFKLDTSAEYFANYVYGFLVLGIIGYFFDNLREKLKSKDAIKIYKKVFLSILIIFLVSSAFIFVIDFRRNSDYTVVIKENFIKFAISTKNKYLKTFKKDIYYSGIDTVEVNGKKISRNIIINIDNPKPDSIITKTIDLSGWAIETNSIYNTGIDRIEFFLDGKPGKGKYLGQFSYSYKPELASKNYIINLYNNFCNRQPTTSELNFWAINLEYNIMSYYDVANNVINESKFLDKSLTNEDFLRRIYAGLLNKDWDRTMLDKMKKDLTRADILYILINSEEFKIHSEIYYKNISLKKNNLDIIKESVGEKYGKQFYLSGFNFKIDSTKYKNGLHTIYVYAHSPIFGWDFKKININIKN